ncbi:MULTISPECIES: TetR/AcrR family transcriptional regulator [unclassified Variovorax]|uniref:TetR/AcrR family transcriptional regulator n=1 Tax=unclassified Variovorax TaxID=663243 RepID=UPI001BD3D517|nr:MULTISPECIES: TetR/AcrR family transcriptional regulator [unclassified Variovorax]
MRDAAQDKAPAPPDHRVEVAARKRAQMRSRLLEATMKVFARTGDRAPAIEDVVREAGVSRGTFYLHFLSLDEALQALAAALSDQMTRDAMPFYDLLKEPWQRFATGFRGFLQRAVADPAWARFVTRSSSEANKLLARDYMTADLQLGRHLGQFSFTDLDSAVDFMMGASAAGIAALGHGVADPDSYMDGSVRMALAALGCSSRHCERGVKFSRDYLEGWASKARGDGHTLLARAPVA